MTKIEIIEVGPRDGLQNQDAVLDTPDKLTLIEKLIGAGARRMEVASFVNPRRVPQMADAEGVVAGLPRRDDTTFIGLVLNERGAERALASGIAELGMVAIASDEFGMRNQKQTSAQSVEVSRAVLRMARAAGRRAQVTISVAFGCPFEGEVDPDAVVSLARELDADELVLADTIGVAAPSAVRSLIERVVELGKSVGFHGHNTRNTGYANALAALGAGATVLDASIGGLGGCPYAPKATGNVATEDLAYLLEGEGIETGVDLDALIAVSVWLEDLLGRQLEGQLYRAGVSSVSA